MNGLTDSSCTALAPPVHGAKIRRWQKDAGVRVSRACLWPNPVVALGYRLDRSPPLQSIPDSRGRSDRKTGPDTARR